MWNSCSVTANANEIDVANLSISGTGTAPRVVTEAISRSIAAGVTYVVAAGNNGMDATNSPTNANVGAWPSNHPDVIAVSNLIDTDGACGGAGPGTSFGTDTAQGRIRRQE